MAEKSPSLATQAYHTIKENILNLTYPPGMVLTEAMLTKELEKLNVEFLRSRCFRSKDLLSRTITNL